VRGSLRFGPIVQSPKIRYAATGLAISTPNEIDGILSTSRAPATLFLVD
jgi:hypothetical protein